MVMQNFRYVGLKRQKLIRIQIEPALTMWNNLNNLREGRAN